MRQLCGDLVENQIFPIFPWYPPTDTYLDPARWIRILRDADGFRRFSPKLVVSGHSDPGSIDVSLRLASYVETVGNRVLHFIEAGTSADEIIRHHKASLIALHPDWLHPSLVDLQIRYFAAQA